MGLIIYCVFGLIYLVYTNIPKTFYIDDLETLWNEFNEHPKFSNFKYKKSTIFFTGVVNYIETSENACCVIFYFGKRNDFKEKYQNNVAVIMNTENLTFKENDKIKLKALYKSSNSTSNHTNIYLKNGEVIEWKKLYTFF